MPTQNPYKFEKEPEGGAPLISLTKLKREFKPFVLKNLPVICVSTALLVTCIALATAIFINLLCASYLALLLLAIDFLWRFNAHKVKTSASFRSLVKPLVTLCISLVGAVLFFMFAQFDSSVYQMPDSPNDIGGKPNFVTEPLSGFETVLFYFIDYLPTLSMVLITIILLARKNSIELWKNAAMLTRLMTVLGTFLMLELAYIKTYDYELFFARQWVRGYTTTGELVWDQSWIPDGDSFSDSLPPSSLNEQVLLRFANPYGLALLTLTLNILAFSYKGRVYIRFKGYGWRQNRPEYLLLLINVLLFFVLGLAAVAPAVVLYILCTIVNNKFLKTKH